MFLSHAGGNDLVVKRLLDFLRRALNALPSVDHHPVAAFLDEADMRQIGKNVDVIAAALRSAPMGVLDPQ